MAINKIIFLKKKLKEHGWKWSIRRVMRELISPVTFIGKYLKFISFFIYYGISSPFNFLYSLIIRKDYVSDSLFFFYDFEVEPVTYDFAWALCIANAKREKLGLSCLKIIFVPGTVQGLRKESCDYEDVININSRNWRIYSILIPLLKLLPCCYGITICSSREEAVFIHAKQAKYIYPDKYNVLFPISYSPRQAILYPQTFAALKADEQALEYITKWKKNNIRNKKLIVITLRQYSFTPARNSNLSAWAQFAHHINKDEFYIIFIPDTEQALYEPPSELKEFNFFYAACWNLILRSALYQQAYLNLGVNTGPMSLCWLNPLCRYITFNTTVEGVQQASVNVMVNKGFLPGKNPRFAIGFQKWVWEKDNFKTILKEFEDMCNQIEFKSESKYSSSIPISTEAAEALYE